MTRNVVDPTPAISRRTFLKASGIVVASTFTSIAGTFVDWLTRVCRYDVAPQFAGAA